MMLIDFDILGPIKGNVLSVLFCRNYLFRLQLEDLSLIQVGAIY